jgi:hypothetical protein
MVRPYFIVVGDETYESAKDDIATIGYNFIRLSDFCETETKHPDLDRLENIMKKDGAEYQKIAILGLGEYLAFCGEAEATSELSRFRDINPINKNVIFILRGISNVIMNMQKDPRFDNRRVKIIDNKSSNINITIVHNNIKIEHFKDLKGIIRAFEDGIVGNIYMAAAIIFDKPILRMKEIRTSYDLIGVSVPEFRVSYRCGTDEQWQFLLDNLSANSNNLEIVFRNNGLDGDIQTLFDIACRDKSNVSWLAFIKSKQNFDSITGYRRYVLDDTETFDDFRMNILNSIIKINPTEKNFYAYYQERKSFLHNFKEFEIDGFIIENRKYLNEAIYKLTDVTVKEREEMVLLYSRIPDETVLKQNYPDLFYYLSEYNIDCGSISDTINKYFKEYKQQKISNILNQNFIETVNKFALNKEYSRLATRNETIRKFIKAENYLYWLDALGVEYAGFISELAKKYNLVLTLEIGRVELPTITIKNRVFFDDWPYAKNSPNGDKRLDEIKHKDTGNYDYNKEKRPIHIVKELDIIKNVIEKAAVELGKHEYKQFVLASDHGASRLAVIKEQEEKYETDTKGEHSGRCCKIFPDYDLNNAVEEDGYLVLTDYGRFKGSRMANVEVHGGASLEEVLVPIVALSLKDNSIKIELIDKKITASYRKNAEITIFSNVKINEAIFRVNNMSYRGTAITENNYKFDLKEIRKAGTYTGKLYDGDSPITELVINVHNEGGKRNDAFEDAF